LPTNSQIVLPQKYNFTNAENEDKSAVVWQIQL